MMAVLSHCPRMTAFGAFHHLETVMILNGSILSLQFERL